jgi:hypothetical protein
MVFLGGIQLIKMTFFVASSLLNVQITRGRKEETNTKTVSPLRCTDNEAPKIPFQYRGGIAEIQKKTSSERPAE